eukprot:6242015-Pyramimonas_sp.AAC.1
MLVVGGPAYLDVHYMQHYELAQLPALPAGRGRGRRGAAAGDSGRPRRPRHGRCFPRSPRLEDHGGAQPRHRWRPLERSCGCRQAAPRAWGGPHL